MQIQLALRNPGFPVRLHRGHVWTLVWTVLGAAAVYFLLPPVGELKATLTTLERVHVGWLAMGMLLVALRYVLAAMSLQAAVGRPIPFGPTMLVQLSSAFIGRFTPEGVGWLVLNQRYLEKAGLSRASAAAAISLKVVAGVIVRVSLTLGVGALAGASIFQFDPTVSPYFFVLPIALFGVGYLAWRASGSRAARMKTSVASGAKDFSRIFHEPYRAATLLATSAGLPIAYGLALIASAMAFGVDVSVVDLFAVYLGGTALAAASPTPGNIGAVEVTLTAGLIAIGVPSAAGLAAVLIYRLLTFWLPLVPGFVAFRYLQAKHHV